MLYVRVQCYAAVALRCPHAGGACVWEGKGAVTGSGPWRPGEATLAPQLVKGVLALDGDGHTLWPIGLLERTSLLWAWARAWAQIEQGTGQGSP